MRRSSTPAWATYGLLALSFVAVEVAVLWADGTFPGDLRLIM